MKGFCGTSTCVLLLSSNHQSCIFGVFFSDDLLGSHFSMTFCQHYQILHVSSLGGFSLDPGEQWKSCNMKLICPKIIQYSPKGLSSPFDAPMTNKNNSTLKGHLGSKFFVIATILCSAIWCSLKSYKKLKNCMTLINCISVWLVITTAKI